jgi:hypothetical protein
MEDADSDQIPGPVVDYRARRMEELNRARRNEDVQRIYRQVEQNVATMQGRAKAKAYRPPPSQRTGEDRQGPAAWSSSTAQHRSKAAAVVWRWAANPKGAGGIPQLPPNPPEWQNSRSDRQADPPAGPPAARPADGPFKFDPHRAPPVNPIFPPGSGILNPIFPPGYKRTSAQKKYDGLFHHLPDDNLQEKKGSIPSTTLDTRETVYEHPNWDLRAQQPMVQQPFTSRDKTLPLRMPSTGGEAERTGLAQILGEHRPKLWEKTEEQLRILQRNNDASRSSSSQWRPNSMQTSPVGVSGEPSGTAHLVNATEPKDPWTQNSSDEEHTGILDDDYPRTKESAGQILAVARQNSKKAERARVIEAEVQARVESILEVKRPHQQPDLIYNGMRVHRCLNCRNHYQCTQPEGPLHLQNTNGLYDCKYCGGTVADETELRVHHDTCREVIRLMKEQKPVWNKTPHTMYQALPDTASPQPCHCTQCNLHWCHNTPGKETLRQQQHDDEEEILAWKMRVLSPGYVKRGYTEEDQKVRQKILDDLIRAECDCSLCMMATTGNEGCRHSQHRRNMEEHMTMACRTAEGQYRTERHIAPLRPSGTDNPTIVDGIESQRSHRPQSHLRHGDPGERDMDREMDETPPNCVDPHITYLGPGRQDPPSAVVFIGPLHSREGRVSLSDDEGYSPEDDAFNWVGTDDNTGRRSHEEIITREMNPETNDIRHPQRNPVITQTEGNRRLMEGRGDMTVPIESGLPRYSDRQYPWARSNRSVSPRNTGTKRKREEAEEEGADTWVTDPVTWHAATCTWEVDEGHGQSGQGGLGDVYADHDKEIGGHPITSENSENEEASKENAIKVVCGSIHLINWNEIWNDNHYGRPPSDATEAFQALVRKTGIPLEEWAQVVDMQRHHDLQQQPNMDEGSESHTRRRD